MKKLLLITLCFSLYQLPLVGQNLSKIDSLSNVLDFVEVSTKIQFLNEIAWEYRLFYPDSTIYYCEKSIELATKYDLPQGIPEAYNFMGIAYMYKGDFTNAFHYHFQALRQGKKNKNSLQVAHAFNNLGRILFSQGDLVKSYDYFFKALEIFEKNEDQQGMGYCYKSLAQLYQIQNDTVKAAEMLQAALKIRIEQSDYRGQISTYQELAKLAEKSQNYGNSFQFLDQAKEISKTIGDQFSLVETELGIAKLFLVQKKYGEALSYAKKAAIVTDDTENQKLLASINLILGEIYYAIHEYENAEYYLTKTIILAEKDGVLESQKDAYYYLSLLHKNSGNFEKALAYHNNYLSIKDSLQDIDKARAIQKLEGRLELAKKESEFDMLKTKSEINQQIIAQEKSKNFLKNLAIGLTLCFLLIISLGYYRIFIKNKELARQKRTIELQTNEIIKKNIQIRDQNEILKLRNESLADLNKEKDNLIGIVAHDLKSPFNSIVSLAELGTMVADLDPEHEKCFSLIKKVAFGGIHLIRDLLDANAFENSQLYHPKEIELNEYLKEKLISFQTEANLKDISIHHLGSDQPILVKTDPLFLARIIDNLVSNALKYSRSGKNVYVEAFHARGGQVKLSIRDEGQGFSEEDKKSLYKKFKKLSAQPTNGEISHGLGLAIVKTLVDRIKGEIDLISKKGKGSEFIISFPAMAAKTVNQ